MRLGLQRKLLVGDTAHWRSVCYFDEEHALQVLGAAVKLVSHCEPLVLRVVKAKYFVGEQRPILYWSDHTGWVDWEEKFR